jgi:hypothetical protein
MTRYDPDQIAALAAGQLEPAEAAALEREIAADPRSVAELAAQRLALEALHRSPAPVLSAEESTTLRRNVATALNLEEGAVARTVTSSRRVPWRSIAVAAAALAVIAVVVPLVGLLSVGGDQAAMTTTADADITARNQAAETGAPLATTPAGAEDQAGADDLAGGLLSAEGFTADAATALEDLVDDPAALIAAAEDDLTTCAAEAADLLGTESQRAAAALPLEAGEVIVWFVSPDGNSVTRLAIFDPAGCTLLATRP